MSLSLTPAAAPCSWGVWYADGRPSGVPSSVFLDGAVKAGYKALELGPVGYLTSDTDKLKDELARLGMSVCSGTACYSFDRYASFADFKDAIDALSLRIRALGARYLVIMDESDVGDRSEKKRGFSGDIWKKYFNMFSECAKWTKAQHGVETVFHPHIKSLVETEAEIEALLDFCPDLKLCFDTGHHAYINGSYHNDDESVLKFIKKYSGRIDYYHFKNIDGALRKKVIDEGLTSDEAFDINIMCDLDRGIIDFKKLKAVLEESQFSGFAVIEMDMPRASADEAFRASKHNLEYIKSLGMIK